MDLFGTDNYLAPFAGALGYSVSPHARRLARVASLGISTRISAWFWAPNKVKENSHDNSGIRADILGAVADLFARFPPDWAIVVFVCVCRQL